MTQHFLPVPQYQYKSTSLNHFEPNHNRFTNYALYEHSPIPSSPENTCISISAVSSERRFALNKNPGTPNLRPLLEERNARFTHAFIFLQCYPVFSCNSRENRIRKPLYRATPVAGEANHPPPVLSFSSLVSCTDILTPSLPSFSSYIFHDPFLFNFCRGRGLMFARLSLEIAPPASNTSRDSHKFILSTFSDPSIKLQGVWRRWCNE